MGMPPTTATLPERRTNARHVLERLMINLKLSDADLAEKVGSTRQTIYNRRIGRVDISMDDIAVMAEAMEVDLALFLGHPKDAIQWLIDNRPEVFEPEFVLSGEYPIWDSLLDDTASWLDDAEPYDARTRQNTLETAA